MKAIKTITGGIVAIMSMFAVVCCIYELNTSDHICLLLMLVVLLGAMFAVGSMVMLDGLGLFDMLWRIWK